MLYEEITEKILGAAFEVAHELGSGFLESVYEKALFIAIKAKGLKVQEQQPIKVIFRGQNIGEFFADLL